MAPILLTALIGIGVKIATDLLVGGAKKMMGPEKAGEAGQSFPATLDKARAANGGAAAAASPATGAALSAPGAGLADRARVLAMDMGGGLPPAQGFAAYRNNDVSLQAP